MRNPKNEARYTTKSAHFVRHAIPWRSSYERKKVSSQAMGKSIHTSILTVFCVRRGPGAGRGSRVTPPQEPAPASYLCATTARRKSQQHCRNARRDHRADQTAHRRRASQQTPPSRNRRPPSSGQSQRRPKRSSRRIRTPLAVTIGRKSSIFSTIVPLMAMR